MAFGAEWFISDPAEIRPFRWALVILAADAALMLPTMVVNAVLIAHYRFDVLSWVQLAALVVRAALIVGLVSRGHSIVALAIVVFGTNMLSRAVLVVMAGYLFPWLALGPALFRRAQACQLVGYGKHAFLASCADRARSTAGILVVALFSTWSTVTHYGIAVRIAQLFAELMLQSLGVVGPFSCGRMPSAISEDPQDLAPHHAAECSGIGHDGGSGFIHWPSFIEVWIGEDYRDAYLPLAILTCRSRYG